MANPGLKHGIWVGTEAGVVTTGRVRILAIIYYVNADGDTCVIYDGSNTDELMTLTHSTAKNNVIITFGNGGKVFPDGLYINSITANSKIYIIPASGQLE